MIELMKLLRRPVCWLTGHHPMDIYRPCRKCGKYIDYLDAADKLVTHSLRYRIRYRRYLARQQQSFVDNLNCDNCSSYPECGCRDFCEIPF